MWQIIAFIDHKFKSGGPYLQIFKRQNGELFNVVLMHKSMTLKYWLSSASFLVLDFYLQLAVNKVSMHLTFE